MTHQDFRSILNNLHAVYKGGEASTHKSVRHARLPASSCGLHNWMSPDKNAETEHRPRAYLNAYIAVFGSSFEESGGELDCGFIHWDKGVIKLLLKSSYIELANGRFVLTSKGRQFLGGNP